MATISDYRIEMRVNLKQFKTDLDGADKLYTDFYHQLLSTTKTGEDAIQKERAKYGIEVNKRYKEEQDAAGKTTETIRKHHHHAVKAAKERTVEEIKEARKREQGERTSIQNMKAVSGEIVEVQKRIAKLRTEGEKASGKERLRIYQELIKAEMELEERKNVKIQQQLKFQLNFRTTDAQKRMKLEEQIAAQAASNAKKQEALNNKLVASTRMVTERTAWIGKNFAMVSESIRKGDFAGVLGTLGGVKGGIIGTVIDGVKEIGAKFAELGEKSIVFHDTFDAIGLRITEMGGDLDAVGGIENLKAQLLAIERPAHVSTQQLADLASTVAAFEPPENIAKTAKAILNLSEIDKATSPEEIARGVSTFGKALGDTALAADLMATVGVSLKGKALDPINTAATNLGSIFAKATATITDTSQAAREGALTFEAFSRTGLEVGEATAQAETLFARLNQAVNNPHMHDAIMELLPKGLSMMDVGLERGNLSVAKLLSSLSNMGAEGSKIAAVIGGPRGVGLNILIEQAKAGALNIDQLVTKYADVTGAAAHYETVLETAHQGMMERQTQNLQRIELGLGDFARGMMLQVHDLTSGVISTVADWFKSAAERFAESKAQMESYITATTELKAATADITLDIETGNTEQAVAAINTQLTNVATIDAEVAETLRFILNAPGTRTSEELRTITETMEQMTELGQMQASLKAAETMGDLYDKTDDALGETVKQLGKMQMMAMEGKITQNQYAKAVETSANVMQLQMNTAFREQITIAEGLLRRQLTAAELQEETAKFQGNMVVTTQLHSTMLGESVGKLDAALGLTRNITLEATKMTEERAKENTELALKAASLEAEINLLAQAETLTSSQKAKQTELAAEHDKIVNTLNDRLGAEETSLAIADQQVAAQDAVNNAKTDSADLSDDLVGLSEDELMLLEEQGIVEKDNNQDRITQLKITRQKMADMVLILKAQLAILKASTQAEYDRAKAALETAKAQKSVNEQLAASATAAATGTAGPAVLADITISEGKGITQLESEIGALEAAIGGASAAIGKLEGSASRGAGGRERSNEREKKADEEAKKLDDERQEREKAALEAKKQLEDQRKKIEDAQLARAHKAAEDQKRIADEIKKAQKAMIDGFIATSITLQKQVTNKLVESSTEISSVADQFRTAAGRFARKETERIAAVAAPPTTGAERTARLGDLETEIGIKDAAIVQQHAVKDILNTLEEIAKVRLNVFASPKALDEGLMIGIEALIIHLRDLQEKGLPVPIEAFAKQTRATIDDLTKYVSENIQKITDLEDELAEARRQRITILAQGRFETQMTGLTAIREAELELRKYSNQAEFARAGLESLGAAIETAFDPSKTITVADFDAKMVQLNADIDQYATEMKEAKIDTTTLASKLDTITDTIQTQLAAYDDAIFAMSIMQGLTEEARKIRDDLIIGLQKERDALKLSADEAKITAKGMANLAVSASLSKDAISKQRAELIKTEHDAFVLSKALKEIADVQDLLGKSTDSNKDKLIAASKAVKTMLDMLTNTASRMDLSKLTDEQRQLIAGFMGIEGSATEVNDQFARLSEADLSKLGTEIDEVLSAMKIDDVTEAFKELGSYLDADFASALDTVSTQMGVLFDPKALGPEKLKASLAIAESLGAALLNAGEYIDGIVQQVEKTGAGAAVEAAGDITMKVGKALLDAPTPLNIAGGVLVGVGLIAKAIGKIAQAIHGVTKSEAEQAEERLAEEQRLLDLQAARLETMEKLVSLGETELDQAKEQLAARKAILAERLRESDLAADMAEMSAQELANEIERAEIHKSKLEAAIAEGEELTENSNRSQRIAFLEKQGFDTRGNTNKRLREWMDEQKVKLADENALLLNGNSIIEDRLALLEYEKEMLEEEIGLIEFRMQLEGESLGALEDIAAARREALLAGLEMLDPLALQAAFEAAGVGGAAVVKQRWGEALAGLSDEDLEKLLSAMAGMVDSELSPAIIDLAEGWLTSTDNITQYNEQLTKTGATTDDLYEKWKKWIKLRLDLGEITQAEYEASMLIALEQQLEYVDSIKDSYETVLDYQLARMEIELEIHNLLEKQNEDMRKSDPIMVKLIRDRQKLMDLIRAEGGISATSAARQAELARIRSGIIAHATEQGWTSEQIQELLDSLPKFHRGGLVTEPGESLARVMGGEYVVDRETTRRIGPAVMPETLDMLASPAGRIVAAGVQRKEAAILNLSQVINLGGIGGISIANDFRGASAERGAAIMTEQLAGQIVRVVNRAIKSGEIRGPIQ